VAITAKELIIKLKTVAETKGLAKASRAVVGFVRTASKAFKGVVTAAKTMAGGVKRVFGVFSKFKMHGLALVASLGGMVREAVKYNVQMARAWTMMSGGIGQFRAMRKEVKGLATDLGLAKSELADGLYQALSAGVPENNVITFLMTAGKVAVADGTSVATAVDGITTVLNAFGIESEKTTEVVDQLFNTVKNGKTTFGELAASLAQAAPVAAAMGVSLEEVLAATATLTKSGTPTAQAMTQIRAAILGLNKALGEGWAASMTLQEGMLAIKTQAEESGEPLLKLVGTQEALVAVLSMTGEKAGMAADDLKKTADAAGSLEEAYKKVDQFRHWQSMWAEILNYVDSVGLSLDRTLAPIVREITAELKKWRENTTFFDDLEEKLTKARELAADIWTAATEGGEAGNLIAAMKGGALNLAQAVARKILEVLIIGSQFVGKAIGSAAGNWMSEQWQKAFSTGLNLEAQARAKGMEGHGQMSYREKRQAFSMAKEQIMNERLVARGREQAGAAAAAAGLGGADAGGALGAIAAEGAAIRSGKITKTEAALLDAVRVLQGKDGSQADLVKLLIDAVRKQKQETDQLKSQVQNLDY